MPGASGIFAGHRTHAVASMANKVPEVEQAGDQHPGESHPDGGTFHAQHLLVRKRHVTREVSNHDAAAWLRCY